MTILDASGRPMQMQGRSPVASAYALRQLNRLVETFDSFAPVLHRVPSVFGAIEARRADRWVNGQTGIGTLADKTRHGFYDSVWRIPDQELVNLMNGSDLASKMVEKRPREMFRRGFDLKANAKPGNGKAGGPKAKGNAEIDQSAIKDFRDFCTEELLLEDRFKQAMVWGRLFGGTLALLGVDDGRDPEDPLDEENIKSFTFLNVVDRRFCWVHSYYSNPEEPKFGEPESYMVSNGVAAQDYRPQAPSKLRKRGWTSAVIHETRVMRFDGVATDMLTRQQLAGWSWSILQRVYEVLRQFEHGFDSAVYLLSDASQGVYKLKGLLQAIGSGNKEFLEQRLQIMEDTRSVIRGVAIDADEKSGESFERVATPMTGIADMIDRLMQRVSAAADMPVQELFGAGAGGLNAAGEAQAATRKWYDTIQSEAQDQAAPKLARLFRLAALAGNSPLRKKDVRWTVEFHPMWEPTDDELAGTQLKRAQRDQIYIETETVSSEVVALALKPIYPSIDEDEIEAAIEAKKTFDPHANDPPPAPKPPFGGPPGAPGAPGASGAPPGAPQPPGAGPAKPGPLPQKTPRPGGSAEQSSLGGGGAGEPQTPTLPVAGPPSEGKTGSGAKGKKTTSRADSKNIASAVHAQLAPDYPESAIAWVNAGRWRGPGRVAIGKLDFSNREKWAASHDPIKIASHVARIKQGIEKPILLVKTPHSKKLAIIDGHHRALAYEKLGMNPRAYVCEVQADHGPWTSMHSMQAETGLEASTQSTKDSVGAGGEIRDAAIVVLFDQGGRVLTVSRPEPPYEMALPGGEVEDEETAQQAAAREVYEETNVWTDAGTLELVAKLTSPTDGRSVCVFSGKTHYVTNPQALEPGTKVAWLRPSELLEQAKLFKSTLEELVRQGVLTLDPRAPAGDT